MDEHNSLRQPPRLKQEPADEGIVSSLPLSTRRRKGCQLINDSNTLQGHNKFLYRWRDDNPLINTPRKRYRYHIQTSIKSTPNGQEKEVGIYTSISRPKRYTILVLENSDILIQNLSPFSQLSDLSIGGFVVDITPMFSLIICSCRAVGQPWSAVLLDNHLY